MRSARPPLSSPSSSIASRIFASRGSTAAFPASAPRPMRSRIAARSKSRARASRKNWSSALAAGNGVGLIASRLSLEQAAGFQADEVVEAAGAEALEVQGHEFEAELAQLHGERRASRRLSETGDLRGRHFN